jgi:hypothetical protein
MHKEVLRAITGIDVFPVISLVLFVIVFAIAAVHAFRLDRQLVDELSSLPFDDAHGTRHALGTPHSALSTVDEVPHATEA